jgi:hypothetical protein
MLSGITRITSTEGAPMADQEQQMEQQVEEMLTEVGATKNESVEDVLLQECCLSYDQLASLCQLEQTGEPVIHLMTQGRENILSYQPRIYKHQLLKSSPFRARVIEYYKALGYAWVDIIVLNRHYWKIFLFQHDPHH